MTNTDTTPDTFTGAGGCSVPEAAHIARATYRQVNSWISRGLINVHADGRGPGYPQHLDPYEVNVLHTMADLVREGVAPDVAVAMARDITTTGSTRLGAYDVRPAPEETP